MANNDKKWPNLSPKQFLTIECLLCTKTRQDAAKLANVPVRTLNRWLCNSAFKNELNRRIDEISFEVGTQLQKSLFDAVETLSEILKDNDAMPSVRVSAARTILEFSLRYKEQIDILKRLETLENNNDSDAN